MEGFLFGFQFNTALGGLLLCNTYSIMALPKGDWNLDPYFYLCNLIAMQTVLKL